jgi:hypothetical protein
MCALLYLSDWNESIGESRTQRPSIDDAATMKMSLSTHKCSHVCKIAAYNMEQFGKISLAGQIVISYLHSRRDLSLYRFAYKKAFIFLLTLRFGGLGQKWAKLSGPANAAKGFLFISRALVLFLNAWGLFLLRLSCGAVI